MLYIWYIYRVSHNTSITGLMYTFRFLQTTLCQQGKTNPDHSTLLKSKRTFWACSINKSFYLAILFYFFPPTDAGPLLIHILHTEQRLVIGFVLWDPVLLRMTETVCVSVRVYLTSAGHLCFTALPKDVALETTCNSSCVDRISPKSTTVT